MEHGIFLLSLLFPHGPTLRAVSLFLPLQELPAAHPAILGTYSLKLGTGIAVGAISRAAFHRIPICAHEPLPVWVIAEIVHAFPQKCIEDGQILPDLCSCLGKAESLAHGGLRRSIPPQAITQHGANLISILCQIGEIYLAAQGLL